MNMTERNYLHSRPLDVHRWSEHPEVNIFVDTIYNNDFRQGNENQRIKKKHLKLVLLDLYVAWFDDPDLNIALHMSQSAYSNGKVFNKGVSRYNELNIKGTTIEIVHRLLELGYIGFKEGYQGSVEYAPRLSRIWAKSKLIKHFEDAAFGYFDVNYSKDREVIILRDEEKGFLYSAINSLKKENDNVIPTRNSDDFEFFILNACQTCTAANRYSNWCPVEIS